MVAIGGTFVPFNTLKKISINKYNFGFSNFLGQIYCDSVNNVCSAEINHRRRRVCLEGRPPYFHQILTEIICEEMRCDNEKKSVDNVRTSIISGYSP